MVATTGEVTAGFSHDPKNKKWGNCTLQANLGSLGEGIVEFNLCYIYYSSKINFWEFFWSYERNYLTVKSNFG